MAEHLTLTENNAAVGGTTAPSLDTNGDGTVWNFDPVSMTIVAWYTASESNIANAGVRRVDQPGIWNDRDLSGSATRSVIMTWSTPDGRVPHHYTLYFQNLAAFDFDEAATRVSDCPGYLNTFEFITLTTTDEDGNVPVFLATTPSVILNPIMQLEPNFRVKTRRGYNGKAYRKAWASDTLVDQLEMVVTQMSTFKDGDLTQAHEGAVQILSWLDNATPLKLAETLAGDAAIDPYIENYYGTVTGFDYLASRGKNSKTDFFIIFDVEAEDKV